VLRKFSLLMAACMLGMLAVVPVTAQDSPQVVNVYSSRHYGAMEAVFNRFTEETGIEVRLSQGSAQSLLERLRAEGSQTPADVFFSIDAGALDLAASEGLLQPVESDVLDEALPDDLRDPDNQWFAISQRLRTIIYNTETVDPAELATYADLADPQWQGRLCLRPATHIYTLALVGNLIHDLGEDGAQAVVEGWVANNPQYIDSDERIIDTLVAGGCDVAIVNHYYVARKLNEDPTLPLGLIWANQGDEGTGVHRNIFGAGVTAAALNRDNAVRLIEWMATEGQAGDETGVPGSNFEFPTNPAAEIAPQLEPFGVPVINAMPLSDYGDVQEAALNLLESAGYGF
jgi:iron(III) transport system substrate-binding protein